MKTSANLDAQLLDRERKSSSETPLQRRLPVGAEVQARGGTHFRVWGPQHRRIELHLSTNAEQPPKRLVEMEPESGGYFSVFVPDARPGLLYKYRLTSGEFPDPASRFQPQGPHGPSQIVDPSEFLWRDESWKGVRREGQILYEMHVGTFTREGTWNAAATQLDELASLGITVIELMPVADFPGRFGWGYDGVNLFAPTRLYGAPDDLRRFVDTAHAAGIGVILDVVYNHFGPDGNYVREFSQDYFSNRYENEWGEPINFDGENSHGVREFFIANAGYWIDEYHLDGLRLDATQQIFDASEDNVMAAMSRAIRKAGKGRATYIVAENECQHPQLVRSPERGGYGMDALWNDDFHHEAIVACTGRNEAYYSDYKGTPQEFISALKWGYLYQGQWYKWQKKRRGKPALDLHPAQFVTYIQNHDQVANSLRGKRLHQLTSPGRFRAITALMLLGPGTPMLFQGQEFGASTPFHYFADHKPELATLVMKGRHEFLKQFPSITSVECQALLIRPEVEETFTRCKLDFNERKNNAEIYRLHHDLLALRRSDPVFAKARPRGVDGAVVGSEAFVVRFFGEQQSAQNNEAAPSERLLLVNFGLDLHLNPAPEPLLAPPEGCQWRLLWSTEDPRYGGCGTAPLETEDNWFVPAHSAVVMGPSPLVYVATPSPRKDRD